MINTTVKNVLINTQSLQRPSNLNDMICLFYLNKGNTHNLQSI